MSGPPPQPNPTAKDTSNGSDENGTNHCSIFDFNTAISPSQVGSALSHGRYSSSWADFPQIGATDPMIDGSIYGHNGFEGLAVNMNLDMSDSPMMHSGDDGGGIGGEGGGGGGFGHDDVLGERSNAPGPSPLDLVSGLHPTGSPSITSSIAAHSIVTDFTKKRGWAAKVMEEIQDLLHILDANGRIKHVSPSVLALTGYKAEDLVDRFINDFIHPDDTGLFAAEMNESIASGHVLRLFYRFKKKDNTYAIFESLGHAHIAAPKFAPNPQNQTAFCQAVFMMSRPYPTKNAELLDSFLEHKIENVRLKRRIKELRREEEAEAEESQRSWRQSQEGMSDVASSEVFTQAGSGNFRVKSSPGSDMGPPERPSAAGSSRDGRALTRENLEGTIGSRPDSIREKMARYGYDGTSHAETIEMLTGLRYQEGERCSGITTGNASPTLIKGDAGIAISLDRDPRTGEKKKKQKLAEEYVCTDCGTLESPEWRKGPGGPKTLCNACGLRWAKKEKKMKHTNSSVLSNGMGGNTPDGVF